MLTALRRKLRPVGTPKGPGNRTRWTKEQEDWIVARMSNEEADGDRRLKQIEDRQLASEFDAKFNVGRTVKSIIHKKAKLSRAHAEIKIQKKPKRYTQEEKSFIIKYKQAGKALEQMITDFQQKFGSEHTNDGLQIKWYRFTKAQPGRTAISRKGQSKKSASSGSATDQIPVNKESTSTRGTRKRKRAVAGGNEQSDAGSRQDNAEVARPSEQTIQNATANEQTGKSTRSRQVKKDSADGEPTVPRQSKRLKRIG
ncbi:hypothetical protein K469DRAFT_801261 [Zopfia rhizophila CBS 207.26]|uniref:Uncharacterized protein n=1 Tax=Zopfia rhizophila CBS 207.26 TaxID=1314779 RepID=A0A6A6ESE5_9PEZI|nr:hypothetical protein K469DRAFT_801261 [Zopfia rhizophila CBS 207.26]